jgi:hypothetical protein
MKYKISKSLDILDDFMAKWRYRVRTLFTRLKLRLVRSYIPKDEFDCSLDIDSKACRKLDDTDRSRYLGELRLRRDRAHEADLAEENSCK